ncbi:alpha/beta hydrolase [Lipingzhangella sp. LS1_29]|uniref:Alpha/beta hydrolase n=1 Tax=Lipingzhangella rawalii TaxID=2055835 RepID=A0ABU2HAS3_9ACTN|nr:alpha/beta fold hydrolase [Lipingzhangella rawalii]MDS1272422.1 alpha/beta hydrolase [Lipingzhangella rawalii]
MPRLPLYTCAVTAAALLLPLAAAPAAQAQDPDPVVFVHGFLGKGDQWSAMIEEFEDRGHPEERLHTFEYDSLRSNMTIASQLSNFVDDILADTDASQVDMVTHSMGGLSSRWYLKELDGADNVGDWVSLGGPNNGTSVAGYCSVLITPCQEMKAGSDFLNQLNADDPTPGNVAYTTFRSPCDLVISPVDSTVLDGADNRQTSCLGHIGMMSDDDVVTEVYDTVAGR